METCSFCAWWCLFCSTVLLYYWLCLCLIFSIFYKDEISNQLKTFFVILVFLYWTWYTVCNLYTFVLVKMLKMLFSLNKALNASTWWSGVLIHSGATVCHISQIAMFDYFIILIFFSWKKPKTTQAQIQEGVLQQHAKHDNYSQIKLNVAIQNISGNTVKYTATP